MLHSTLKPFGASDPFADMRRMQSDINRLFGDMGQGVPSRRYPPVNFWAGDDSVVLTVELPGLTQDDIDLTVKDHFVTIRGEHPAPARAEGAVWHRNERVTGRFSRAIELPFQIDPNRVEARFVNGVLQIEMQRPEEDKPKRIQIKSS